MSMDKELDILTKKFQKMMIRLNERQLRQYLATEAEAIGYGGVARVVRASGVSRKTIEVGMKEINSNEDIGKKVRRRGGGRNYHEITYLFIRRNNVVPFRKFCLTF